MKIYTKTGDTGETSLYGGDRVPKDHARLRTYGTLDELNAALGLALTHPIGDPGLQQTLARLQSELFQLGAELATPRGKKIPIELIQEQQVELLEKEIDRMEKVLSPLKNFVLPGGSPLAAALHLARTICRRGERELILVHRAEPIRPVVLEYINRLSDYLFVASRMANHLAGVQDIPWKAPAKNG